MDNHTGSRQPRPGARVCFPSRREPLMAANETAARLPQIPPVVSDGQVERREPVLEGGDDSWDLTGGREE